MPQEYWLVVKRGLYYKPDDCGYTGIRDHAGRYTHDEAKARECPDSGVTIVRLDDAPEFTKNCFEDYVLKYLKEQRDELRAMLEVGVEMFEMLPGLDSTHDAWLMRARYLAKGVDPYDCYDKNRPELQQ